MSIFNCFAQADCKDRHFFFKSKTFFEFISLSPQSLLLADTIISKHDRNNSNIRAKKIFSDKIYDYPQINITLCRSERRTEDEVRRGWRFLDYARNGSFHIKEKSFEVFPFRVIDVDRMVGRLVQAVEDAYTASGPGCRRKYGEGESFPVHHL